MPPHIAHDIAPRRRISRRSRPRGAPLRPPFQGVLLPTYKGHGIEQPRSCRVLSSPTRRAALVTAPRVSAPPALHHHSLLRQAASLGPTVKMGASGAALAADGSGAALAADGSGAAAALAAALAAAPFTTTAASGAALASEGSGESPGDKLSLGDGLRAVPVLSYHTDSRVIFPPMNLAACC